MAYKQDLATGNEIANERKAGCEALRQQVMQPKISHGQGDNGGIDDESCHADGDESQQLEARIRKTVMVKRQSDGQGVRENTTRQERRGRRRQI
jgi:hypothetical protein